ncbi:hypothetical protein GSI_10093 [Ganoderma sinense ZZ0214-1]|uniref:Uncharacterized protein n=1 Tax=Ganoderma sinense ZZ0214-1 TaxID=1077348 RepID=A0A2G8RZM3_9APHY|nr:hypothetical protein GSI_10093 [Ganoderma sinense ZZ0214-1]
MTGRLSYVAAYEEYADNFEWFAVEPLDGDVREGLARVRQHLDAPHLVDLDEPLYAVTLPNRGDEWRTKFRCLSDNFQFSDGTGGGGGRVAYTTSCQGTLSKRK